MTDGLAGDKEREHKAGASKLTGLGGRPGGKDRHRGESKGESPGPSQAQRLE